MYFKRGLEESTYERAESMGQSQTMIQKQETEISSDIQDGKKQLVKSFGKLDMIEESLFIAENEDANDLLDFTDP